jgi:Ca-activated chloride channel family protein
MTRPYYTNQFNAHTSVFPAFLLRSFITVCFLCLLFASPTAAQGVAIVYADEGVYFHAQRSDVRVQVENQVAVTVATTWFHNQLVTEQPFKFGFPMPTGATATGLRWQRSGVWYEADFQSEPQDTTLPGGNPGGGTINNALLQYLGATPLYFQIEGMTAADSLVAVELTFVQLLPYKFGVVSYFCPGNYNLIQQEALENQHFEWTISSSRLIESVEMPAFPDAVITVEENTAEIIWDRNNAPATQDREVNYTLNADDLGLFSLSNYFPDSALTCDDFGRGFCAFIVEPAPNPDGEVIEKVFTLIIDRSGSMSGVKMTQAKEAARFIVQHMNTGDRFNIIAFDNQILSFKPDHVLYTPSSESEALAFIDAIGAAGSTNISGAFETAIPQFQNDLNNTYNIILFFTDGQATAGITNPDGILNAIRQKILQVEANLSIFCFGIGNDVNKALLTNISNENKGVSAFLDNNEVAEVISDFYLTVKNPVLLNTDMEFVPALVSETYPIPLPNLFKGIQMLVVGRYAEPADVQVNFSGEAFGASVDYHYPMTLSGTDSAKYHFLPKLWAKQKAEFLLQKFYSASSSIVADSIKTAIEALGVCYGVVTPFTSFIDNTGGPTSVFETAREEEGNHLVTITAVNPNPAIREATVFFSVKQFSGSETVRLRVVDVLGTPVQHLFAVVSGEGTYEIIWDLKDFGGKRVPPGTYWLELETSFGKAVAKVIVR